MAQHLTDAVVKRLPTPAKGKMIHLDDEVIGFGIRITAAGARSYVLRYTTRAGRERVYTIGSAEAWRCTVARAKAKDLRHDIEDGGDPLADIEDARAAPTVADLIERFEAEHLPRKAKRTTRDYRGMLDRWVRPHFGAHAKVAEVTFADIDKLHRKITADGAVYQANRVISVVSKMFNLAIRWGMRDSNPCRGVERNREHARKRYLSPEELARLTKALAEHEDRQACNIVRICLLTGCRKGEAFTARWGDIDLTAGVWSKPGASVKQREAHIAPLSAPARQLLSEIRQAQIGNRHALPEFVFPSETSATGHRVEIKKVWGDLCKAADLHGLRVHDLRHSFASQLVSGGASLPLIGALLGHSNPNTTARYSHLYDDPLRAAVEKVGAAVANAGRVPEPPVELKRRGRP